MPEYKKEKPGLAEHTPVFSCKLIGAGKTPLVIADNFHPDPDSLRQQAATLPYSTSAEDFYPGVRADAPGCYISFINHMLPAVMSTANAPFDASVTLSRLSLATTAPGQLKPIQCVPHFDSVNDKQWAMVHYLSASNTGGTGFYRHRDTAFEKVNKADAAIYMKRLKTQATTVGFPPNEYIDGTTELFVHIGQANWAYNRAIFYPSTLFHSAQIIPHTLSDHPLAGRLTGNACIELSTLP